MVVVDILTPVAVTLTGLTEKKTEPNNRLKSQEIH